LLVCPVHLISLIPLSRASHDITDAGEPSDLWGTHIHDINRMSLVLQAEFFEKDGGFQAVLPSHQHCSSYHKPKIEKQCRQLSSQLCPSKSNTGRERTIKTYRRPSSVVLQIIVRRRHFASAFYSASTSVVLWPRIKSEVSSLLSFPEGVVVRRLDVKLEASTNSKCFRSCTSGCSYSSKLKCHPRCTSGC
jgi:hypothetical protein